MPGKNDSLRGSVFTAALSRVWYLSLLVGAYSSIPLWVGPLPDQLDLGVVADAILATALGFLLVFRMNRAYERWWEARTLWGTLVNASRNLAIKVRELTDATREDCGEMRDLIVGFAYGLKEHLRERAGLDTVRRFVSTLDDAKHLPSHVARRVYGVLRRLEDSSRLGATELFVIDREARTLMDVAGGCERIKNTQMSQSFPTLVRQALALYLLYFPWSLARELGLYTVPASIVFSYFIIAAEGIAHYVERPFGEDEDHLDLDAICSSIDASVTEILAGD